MTPTGRLAVPAPRSAELLREGFGVRLDRRTRTLAAGSVLLGGSPMRMVRLTAAGAREVASWGAGGRPAGRAARALARRLVDGGVAHPLPHARALDPRPTHRAPRRPACRRSRLRIVAADRAPTTRIGRFEAQRSPLDMGGDPVPAAPRTRIPYVPTAALVVRRAALPPDGFDEAMTIGEDVDLVWRLSSAGWTVR